MTAKAIIQEAVELGRDPTPSQAYVYAARQTPPRRIPEFEPLILTRPDVAMAYAHKVIGGRWPKLEEIILRLDAKGPPRCGDIAVAYAYKVIGGPWPEIEPLIKNDPLAAAFYAVNCLNGRWQEAEEAIATEERPSSIYLEAFPEAKEDWMALGWIPWL